MFAVLAVAAAVSQSAVETCEKSQPPKVADLRIFSVGMTRQESHERAVRTFGRGRPIEVVDAFPAPRVRVEELIDMGLAQRIAFDSDYSLRVKQLGLNGKTAQVLRYTINYTIWLLY